MTPGTMNRRLVNAKKLFSAAAIGTMLLTTVPMANAAVKPGRSIEVFYGREFVGLGGYPTNTDVRVDVLRGPNNVVIGSVTAATDGAGELEVNHLGGGQFGAGGDCWAPPVSPNIMPGDLVRTTVVSDPTDVDDTTVRNIWIDQAATTVDTSANTITMKGYVRSTAQAPINIENDVLELRLNANGFTWQSNNNRRDLRDQVVAADFADGDDDTTTFTHVFQVSDADADRAAASGFEQGFEWATGALRELTVYDGDEVTAGCPPQANYAVTSSNPKVINASNAGTALVVSGVSQDATSVTVTLGSLKQTATPSPTAGAQAWQVTFPEADVGGLADGNLTASASYAVAGGSIGGTNLTILKDTATPQAPKANPASGTLNETTSVALTLTPGEPTSTQIRYDFGASSVPDETSTLYTTKIVVDRTTTINSIAIDAAGNKSTVSSHVYTFGPAAPAGLAATAGDARVGLSWTASDGAASYNVYRGTTSGSLTKINSAAVTSTSYNDTTVTNGTTYFYAVSALDSGGIEGTKSAEVSARPQVPAPGAPTNLRATAGNAQVSLNWTGVTGATRYDVKRGTAAGGPYQPVGFTSGTSHVDTGLTNGTPYFYVVTATNAAGESGNSNEASATPIAPDTTAPTVSMTAPANGATVSGTSVAVSANASDNVGMAGVQFQLDGVNLGAEDTTSPYSVNWNTTTATNGSHALRAIARDAAGNTTTSAAITVNVSNGTVSTRIKDMTFESSLTGANGADSVSGAVTRTTNSPIKGTASAQAQTTTSTTAYLQEDFTGVNDLYVSFYLRVPAIPANSTRVGFVQGATNQTEVFLQSTGRLRLRFNGTTIGADSAVLSPNTVYRIGIVQKAGTGANGVVQAFVATGDAAFGAPFAQTTSHSSTAQATRFRIGITNAVISNVIVDDVRLDSAAMP